jgi:hypothetical protein
MVEGRGLKSITTIMVELDGSTPAMFMQPEMSFRLQLFATSKTLIHSLY